MAPPKKIKEAKELLSAKTELIKLAKPGLDAAIAAFNKKYGDNSLYWMIKNSKEGSDGWSTDLFGLDYVFGRRGPVRGRIIEISGMESSGKTTAALRMAAAAQRKGGIVLYIDQEHTLDPTWAIRNGLDLDSMLIAQPSSGEEALFLCETMAGSGLVDVIIVDSVPSLLPKEVLDKDPGDAFVAAIPRLLNPSLARINNLMTESGTTIIFINQMRDIIDRSGFGGPKRMTPGGYGLKFYSSYRIEMIRIASIKSKAGINIGNEIKIRSIKNKCASPFRDEVIEIMFWEDEQIWGMWEAADIYNICTQIQLIDPKQRTKRFLPENLVIGDGEVNAKLSIHRDEELRDKILFHVRAKMGYGLPFYFNESLAGKLNPVATNKLALEFDIEDAPADILDSKGESEGKEPIPEIIQPEPPDTKNLEALIALASGMMENETVENETVEKETKTTTQNTPLPKINFPAFNIGPKTQAVNNDNDSK